MNVVDSCGWLEYFANGSNADFFAPALEDTENLLVPALIVFEVCKRVTLQRGEKAAQSAADFMAQGTTVSFDADTALNAALYSAKYQLALADSLILQISKEHHATLWTQDSDLKGHPGVQYKAKINNP
ncbi:MAG: type II toxin-antitoxin system VapC family toxin [Methylophilus methylotrophus]|jgi:predicted nucleic acid-binding protein|uniref:Type II toxin-antitoxin system VapC family toxin n=1 Tax=Methylophilus methylotrophus TaxID=17 RepID=A0A5C7WK84_METME|nr:MAG: type II toxin-antitoxin system VapC family toxin [Methylophilus methylotrophus]